MIVLGGALPFHSLLAHQLQELTQDCSVLFRCNEVHGTEEMTRREPPTRERPASETDPQATLLVTCLVRLFLLFLSSCSFFFCARGAPVFLFSAL